MPGQTLQSPDRIGARVDDLLEVDQGQPGPFVEHVARGEPLPDHPRLHHDQAQSPQTDQDPGPFPCWQIVLAQQILQSRPQMRAQSPGPAEAVSDQDGPLLHHDPHTSRPSSAVLVDCLGQYLGLAPVVVATPQ